MKSQLPFYVILPLLFMACKPGGAGTQDPDVLAIAYGEKLFVQDVQQALKGRELNADSAFLFDEYIQTWVKKQALLHEASLVLSDKDKNKKQELEDYENDLIMYEFEKKLLSQNLELEIEELDILEYYNKHKKNFELKENIVKLVFFKLPKNVNRINRLWGVFVRGTDKDLEKLTKLSVEQGGNFNRDEDKWFSFNDILKEIPINTYNQENYLSNHKNIRIDDKDYVYFVKILSFRVKNNISPYKFEKNKIRNILINKRKTTLLKQLQDKIVQEAYNNNQIEIFD
jgi:hypothetical protein